MFPFSDLFHISIQQFYSYYFLLSSFLFILLNFLSNLIFSLVTARKKEKNEILFFVAITVRHAIILPDITHIKIYEKRIIVQQCKKTEVLFLLEKIHIKENSLTQKQKSCGLQFLQHSTSAALNAAKTSEDEKQVL